LKTSGPVGPNDPSGGADDQIQASPNYIHVRWLDDRGKLHNTFVLGYFKNLEAGINILNEISINAAHQ
jgi:hypothetical protein